MVTPPRDLGGDPYDLGDDDLEKVNTSGIDLHLDTHPSCDHRVLLAAP